MKALRSPGTVAARLACVIFALLFLACVAAGAQPGARAAAAAAPAPAAPATDPFDRATPRSTLAGFSRAVHRNDLARAAQYLQAGRRSPQETARLARALNSLLDEYFEQSITTVSAAPEGDLNDGLPANRERLPLNIGSRAVDLQLVRVEQPGKPAVWLFSQESLAQVPRLDQDTSASWIERLMPAAMADHMVFGASVAQWLVLASFFLLPLALLWVLSLLATRLLRRQAAHFPSTAWLPAAWERVRVPLVAALALTAQVALAPLAGLSLNFRLAFGQVLLVVSALLLPLLVWRVLSVLSERARWSAQQRGYANTRSLILLGERVVKVLILVGAVLALLAVAGVETSTALAGLGIGGVALALGAQKTVENLLGGVMLLSDQALAVGDFCRVSGRLGWIEDITLRSVRIRTVEQTLLSVPAGQLAQGTIENFATRSMIPMQHMLRLRHGASIAQLRTALTGIQNLLARDPRVDPATLRVRLVAFGLQAIELELFANLLTRDGQAFLQMQEELLLGVAALVEDSGCAFAEPGQPVLLPAPQREALAT